MPHDETSGALEAFRKYTQAFRALDARAVAQHFHEPAFFITPGDVLALPTVEAVEQTHRQVMADMPLMPFGMTYTLRRSDQTWRIVVAAIHAPDGGPGR
jgi:hypothetical protein